MHTIILGFIICLFLYFGFHTVNRYESFATDEMAKTNDLSFGLVEFSVVPFSSASTNIKIGLVKTGDNTIPQPRKINRTSEVFDSNNIVGIKVPDGLRVTIYEDEYLQGKYNTINGPSSIEDLVSATNLQYPEEEDEEGNILTNKYGGIGWQYRVKSFAVQRSKDVPDEFDSVFYTQKYGINDYEKIKQQGGDLTNLPDKTREAQWQHYLDIGESLGYDIN